MEGRGRRGRRERESHEGSKPSAEPNTELDSITQTEIESHAQPPKCPKEKGALRRMVRSTGENAAERSVKVRRARSVLIRTSFRSYYPGKDS